MKTTFINHPNLYLLIIYLPVIFPKKQTSEASTMECQFAALFIYI